jgi:hypothetical protein
MKGMRFGWVALITGIALLSSAPVAESSTDYTWTGASTSSSWASGADWAGGLSPTGTSGTLSFPQLTSPACTAATPTVTCYRSNNNNSGLAANAITIDDSQPYVIGGGYPISLGSGGLTATPDSANSVPSQPATFDFGFDLSAPQTWSIDGGSQQADGLIVGNGIVTGDEPLTVDFSNEGTLQMTASVGPLTASGPGALIPNPGGYLNGYSDSNQVTLENGAALWAPYSNSTVGPLSDTGGDVLVGEGVAPDGTLVVDGPLDLGSSSGVGLFIDQTGTTAGSDYSALGATGNITLSGASLTLDQGANSDGNCGDLNPGDIDALLGTSGGTITGTFASVPNGTTVTIDNQCDNSTQSATATINYTSTAVTATIVSGGNAGDAAQNTSPPTISGTPAVGQTLTAAPGSWAGNPTFTYQWYSCTSSACVEIPGATSTTYVPTSSQLGDQVAVAVTGTNSAGANTAPSNPTAAIEQAVPANTAAPTISGTTTEGDTLTASPGSWSGTPTAYSYQWLRCNSASANCAAITTATKATTYVLTTADVGNTIAVNVIAANSTGASSPVTSRVTAVVAPAAVAPRLTSAALVVNGNLVVGQTLLASGAQFSGSPLSYASAWERCSDATATTCTVISGADASSYELTATDAGSRLRFVAGAFNTAGKAFGVSQLTAVVLSTAQVKAGLVKLLGPTGGGARLATVLNHGGYSVRYPAPASGLLNVSWTATVVGHRLTIATCKITLQASGTIRATAKLTGAGRRLLKSLRRAHVKLTFTSTISFELPSSTPITASRSLTLKP